MPENAHIQAPEYVIERAVPSDAEMLLDFLKQAGSETDNLSFGCEGLPISAEAEAAYLTQIRDSYDDVMLIAKQEGKIIGTASLNRLPRRMSHRGDLSVSVAKAFWNQGIGSKLLSEITEFARNHGFEVIDLQVRSDNAGAIHLYEKFGFRKIGAHPVFFKIDNDEIPFDIMCLKLN